MNPQHKLSQALLNDCYRMMLEHVKVRAEYDRRFRVPPRPLTRRERVARWFRIRGDRVALAWRVLRGDDIHEDCE